jgi:hypothetical protein
MILIGNAAIIAAMAQKHLRSDDRNLLSADPGNTARFFARRKPSV